MSWHGYEPSTPTETTQPLCQVVLELFSTAPGAAGMSIRMSENGPLPESREERVLLAEALEREFTTALHELLPD